MITFGWLMNLPPKCWATITEAQPDRTGSQHYCLVYGASQPVHSWRYQGYGCCYGRFCPLQPLFFLKKKFDSGDSDDSDFPWQVKLRIVRGDDIMTCVHKRCATCNDEKWRSALAVSPARCSSLKAYMLLFFFVSLLPSQRFPQSDSGSWLSCFLRFLLHLARIAVSYCVPLPFAWKHCMNQDCIPLRRLNPEAAAQVVSDR